MDEDLKHALEAMRQENAETAAETRRQFDERLNGMSAELRQYFEARLNDMSADMRNTAAETRRHFEVVAEGLETKIDFLTEGHVATNERIDRLDAKVDGIDAKVDSLAAAMANEFENTRSMIEFSHHELDVRVRALEEKRPAGSR
jgi:hypothetical protein